MSSRALRKLQREQEQQQQLQHGQSLENQLSELEGEDEEEEETPRINKQNVFDMLNGDDQSQEDKGSDTASEEATGAMDVSRENLKPQPSIKRKRKKKGKAKSSRTSLEKTNGETTKASTSGSDDIDLALKSLSMNTRPSGGADADSAANDSMQTLHRLLAVDTKNLNALNEMKRLFGNVVLEADDHGGAAAGAGRRRGRGPQQLDLGGALAGRNAPGGRGQGLAGLALRRNVFMQGNEEWPRATGGGLGMEVVEKHNDGTIEYRFLHNSAYQDVQGQFEACVESLEPERMIQLLQFNPYHISTLLQVSEIAKQQGDHSVSGDLLERALFSFGRSVHSSFATSIAEGRACLDFRRPENREFWLAAWRYTTNLSMRGTWRTAYEWAKLLLSLDPEGDPYRIGLVIDQFALRARQAEDFLNLIKHPLLKETWHCTPNIEISTALAEYKLGRAKQCRSSLRHAIQTFPWVFERLFQELNINHIPKAIWGVQAMTDVDHLWSELYVRRAKDLWNTPEAISLLVEVAESRSLEIKNRTGIVSRDITLDEARHVLLSDTPTLISFIPRRYTTMVTSSSDPLPPPDNLASYSTWTSSDPLPISRGNPHVGIPPHQMGDLPLDEASELRGLQSFFSRIVSWLRARSLSEGDAEHTAGDIDRAVAESGVTPEVIEERRARMIELQERLQGGEDVDIARRATEVVYLQQLAAERENERARHHNDEAAQEEEDYDDERNQRWLAGRGLMQLRDFVAANGVDEGNWDHETNAEPLTEYARRVLQLQRRATRNFILDYVLQQGTSNQVRNLVDRYIENASRGLEG
ncbi:MAG: hypothetical protein M1830_009484 [Pleopsidium flavum]|nr:MAG: hypothetical protein M1830_009484 [Pleopsidium flavum]